MDARRDSRRDAGKASTANLKTVVFGSRNRIGRKLIILIVAFSSLIALLISVVELGSEYRDLRRGLDRQLDQLAIYIPSISGSVWDFDEKQIQLTLDALALLPNIDRVSVTAHGDQRRWDAGKAQSTDVATRRYSLSQEGRGKLLEIGTLEVAADLGSIRRQIAGRALSIVLSNALKIMLVAIFMAFLFRRMVTSRLENLALKVNRLALATLHSGSAVETVPQAKPAHLDELASVEWAVEQTASNLGIAVAALQKLYKELENRVAEQEALLQNALVGIVMLRQRRIVSCNQRFEEIFGYGRGELIGQLTDILYLTAGECQDVEGRSVETLAHGLNFNIALKMKQRDGAAFWAEITGRAIDRAHADEGSIWIYTDITERKRNESELHDRAALMKAVVDTAIDGFINIDEACRIIAFNAAAERIFGYRADEVMGCNIKMLMPPPYQSQHDTYVENYLAGGVPKIIGIGREVIGQRKDGSTFPMDLAVCEVRLPNRRIFTGMVRDISERKRAEAELLRHRDHLEELVAERTAALKIAMQRADVANQAKSTFLSSMSHELRTPLNAILGYAQILLRDRQLGERQALGLNTIQKSGEHLLTLINDILDLAKIEAGKLELSPQAFNLPVFLDFINDIIRVKAEQKNLTFAYETSGELPQSICADEKRLRQILLNLLSNAVKFTDHGQVGFRVRCQPGGNGNGDMQAHLRFDIQDSGIGMAPQELRALFQPFTQVGSARRQAEGTGLGLAISQQLAHLMKSEIHAESQHNAGSRFWFDITVQIAAAMPEVPEQMIATAYQGPRKTVLVVDDIAENRAMLTELLSVLGFETAQAANGQEALTQAQAVTPDLIVMDMVMPVMDGMEAMRRIRATPRLQDIPVIAVSASTAQGDQASSLAAGADAFLAKPLEHASLLRQIGILLGLHWITEAPPHRPGAHEDKPGAMILPPLPEMEALYQLALLGNMRDIRAWADRIEQQDRQYRPFADKLRTLAGGYQSKAILTLIKEQRDKATMP